MASTVTIPALPTIAACDLPPQIHVGAMPTRERFRAPSGHYISCKPKDGGLWTSSLTEDGTSGWIEWCRGEMYESVDAKDWWQLTAKIGTPVLMIDSEADLLRVAARYGRQTYPDSTLYHLDYDAMVGDRWAGLHLTEEGQWATRYSHPYSLYGWDCESTLWF